MASIKFCVAGTFRSKVSDAIISRQMPWREIIASETFERKVPATQNLMEAITGAFYESLGKTLKAIVIWTLNNGDANKPERLRTPKSQTYLE